MVPNGWKRVPIKDACESIIDCVNKTAPVVDYETPFKMIRTTNVRNGRVNTEDVRYVTEETYLQWVRRGRPQVGDIIFTREAPVGEVGILEDAHGIFLGQRTMMYRASNRRADNYFLFYALSSQFCQKQIEDLSNGGTVAHMRVPDCSEILINLPPRQEQNKIAKIISTWDRAISTTEQLLANIQQQKKVLMQQLLTGKKRLLDSNGVRFSEEWITIPLEKICHINPKRPPEPKDGLVSFIPMEFVSEDAKLLSTSERFYTDVSKGFTSFLDGDTLIAKITPCFENGKGCYVQGMRNGVGFGSTEFHVLRANKLSSPLFLYYMTNTSEFRIKGEANMQGSAGQKRVTTDYLKSLKVTIPKQVQEQQKIATVLSTADQEISALQQKLDTLKQEKKALMQQLLTGKRRVTVN
ncbi:restriction endonuclease subunit S [Aeromonas salmonicida]|uniref:restriction endonuclease subunit S n=1 Tax=Aeromonas salmonicida TaxID=645 RepID=UPI003D05BFDD